MIELQQDGQGSAYEKLRQSGVAGLQPEIAKLDGKGAHDHNGLCDNGAPPIGRGLQERIGAISRVNAIETQGGSAVLAKLREMKRGPHRHKRHSTRTMPQDVPFCPVNGEDKGDKVSLTLGVCQEELRDVLLERGIHAARQYAGSIVAIYPHWAIALTKQLEFEILTRGIK